MKLKVKFAGLGASFLCSLVILPGVFNSVDPFQTLFLAVPSALLGGFLGYSIGDTLSKPKKKLVQGTEKQKNSTFGASNSQKAPKSVGSSLSEARETPLETAITGDETFLDDLPLDLGETVGIPQESPSEP